ncbi:unnamed protein product [Closterium sp. NIES-65]|nr:unnamed protein product [Closterium sp. NIES-65]
MASPSVLTFDDGLSLFDLTSGASPAPTADADATVCSQWATRDAAARLAVGRHLPTTERAHFSQYKSAQTLYDAVVARYSSLATTALSRLMLPFLFPDLAAFPTVADLITHLRTLDTRYRAALPAEFCAKNPPPMYITLYYIVTRLPDSLRVVRDHFLSVCPTTLSVDLLEKALLAIEKSIVTVGASRGDPRTPVFEGCSPSPLLPSVASAATAELVGFEPVGAVSAPSGRRRTGKARGARALEGVEGAVEVVVEAVEGLGVVVGVVPGEVAAAAAVEVAGAVEVAEGAKAAEVVHATEVEEIAEAAKAAAEAEAAVVERVATLRRGVAPVVVSASSSSGVVAPIFDLDFDVILAAMYVVADSVEGACYLCVPHDPGVEAAALGAGEATALGASESAAPGAGESAVSGTTSAQAFHTFTLDSGASRSFF